MTSNLKKTGKFLWAGAPHNAIGTLVKDGINVPERQYLKDIKVRNKAKIKQHFADLKTPRDPWAPGAPDMSMFNQVLDHWGITIDQLPKVRLILTIKAFVFFVMGLWCSFYLVSGASWAIAGIPGLALGFSVALADGWRAQVLHRQRFTYFKDWFLFGIFDSFGVETPIAQAERFAENNKEKGGI